MSWGKAVEGFKRRVCRREKKPIWKKKFLRVRKSSEQRKGGRRRRKVLNAKEEWGEGLGGSKNGLTWEKVKPYLEEKG